MHHARGIFKRNGTYVAVRDIRLSATEKIAKGTELTTKDYRYIILRRWWNIRRIGHKGTAWVESMLSTDKGWKKPEVVTIEEKPRRGRKKKIAVDEGLDDGEIRENKINSGGTGEFHNPEDETANFGINLSFT